MIKQKFKKMNMSLLVLLAMAATLLTFTACNDDDDDMDDMGPTEDIIELAQGTSSLSTLVTAVTAADLVTTLQGDGPFTVFAPTDDAFAALPDGALDYLLDNPSELAKVLQYHVVSGKVLSSDLSTGAVTTLNGDIEVMVSGGSVTINGTADVVTPDVEATNGVVHIIDEVLLPEGFEVPPTKNVVELAQASESLSTLVTAVTEADLATTLSGDGPFTVFAPTNDAFDALPDGVLDYLLANPDELANILKYHVVDGAVFSGDLTTGAVTTLNGTDIDVDVTSGVVINGSSEVVSADIEGTNGVVHVINEVLIPEGFIATDIVEVALAADGLDSLVKALTLFPDLVETLGGTGNFTVFAPTNEAFVGLLSAIGQEQLTDIPESVVRTVLEYHVVAGKVKSTDLMNGAVTTVAGEDITVDLMSGVMINTATVTTADVGALNGVVHVINEVLVPPSILPVVGTIVAPAYFNKNFSTLIAAVEAADEDILSVLLGEGTGQGLTLFAPTNAAFEAAGITELPDGATLSAVLKYHVVDGTVMAADLPVTTTASAEIESLGGMFYLSNKGGDAGVFINGTTQVIMPNIEGSNGVVHVIDKTLLPPSNNVVEIAQSFDPDEFTQLVAAVARTSGEGTDLLAALSGAGDFTVFAPTDAAFEALLDTDASWNTVDDIPLATLTAVLQHHVVGGARVFSTDLATGAATTLNGDISIDAGTGIITDGSGAEANLTTTLNVLGTNGVIHVIDKVLLP